ncbi:MAG: N-acetylmuramoyl-L-alanine amidase, partial [Candidatus Binataceae bacterium]
MDSRSLLSGISAMLFGVRNIFFFATLIFGIAASGLVARELRTPTTFPPAQDAREQQQESAQPQPASPAQVPPAPVATQAPVHAGPVIVLNPAHGATDTGARGENGIFEKDVVLRFALAARAELQRQGYRVVMTRTDDSNPSY